jgi:hypothetical protein
MVLSGDREAVRTALITALVEEHRLLAVADEACAAAGVPDRQQAAAYCLAVLVEKRTAATRYGLDVTDPDFGLRLREQAAFVAAHLHRWAATYQAIQDEADRFELTTMRRYVNTSRGDDVVDTVAAALAQLIADAVPIAEMELSLLYVEEPTGSEYVFQSPLDAWIRTGAGRLTPRETDELEEQPPLKDRHRLDKDGLERAVIAAEVHDAEVLGLLTRRVTELLASGQSLEALISRADGFESEIARMQPESATHRQLLVRLRATIADRADSLVRERRALRDLLAYVVLALGHAQQLQAVAILSLHGASIEPEVAATLATQMRQMIRDLDQPTPSLLVRTESATARGVSRRRASALRKLRDRPDQRASRLTGVTWQLEHLPPPLADNAALGAAMARACDAHTVAVHRSAFRGELKAVDDWMERVYRRYEMEAR